MLARISIVYDVFQEGEWHEVVSGIPKDKDRIRFGL